MAKCTYCGKEVSRTVYPLHLKRCPDRPIEEIKKEEPAKEKLPFEPEENEPSGSGDYEAMTEEYLRAEARDRGVSSWHVKGVSKLISELKKMDSAE